MSMGAQRLSALIEQLEVAEKWARYDRPSQWEGLAAQMFSREMQDCAHLLQHAGQAAYAAQETARMVVIQLQEVAQAMGAGRLQRWVV